MPDNTAANVTPIVPGKQTSEYFITKLATILGFVAFTVGVLFDVLSAVTTAFPTLTWVGPMLNVTGIIGTVLAQLGYNKGRVLVKTSPYTGQLAPAPKAAA